MKLSIVIVNYNVRYFLEQCVTSLLKAMRNYSPTAHENASLSYELGIRNYELKKTEHEIEIIVVDNNSVDGSVKLIKDKFPQVKLIENKKNIGFAKANNMAIRQAKGEYVLLLNPDTVVEDDTIEKVVSFMDSHPDAGGLGVKMLNGKGKFLPESKRGIPTPEVAFYKIFGLSKLFPKSKRFGKYHQGYLDKDEIHKVPVLSGAFMLLRKEAIDKLRNENGELRNENGELGKRGLFDERFFMYGEDIDLSYRLIKAGYNNYYYPETRIIHYKGESTKKSSINYVLMFYRAMIIFAKKHFTKKNASLLTFLINIAIYLRASVAIVNRVTKRIFIPLADVVLIYTGIYFIKNYWEELVIGHWSLVIGHYYPETFMMIVVPVYLLIWLISVYLSGGYDKPYRLKKTTQGLFIGTVFILVIYALLPETIRFSRALILLGTAWAFVVHWFTGSLVHWFTGTTEANKKYVIIGDEAEANRVAEVIRRTNLKPAFIGLVSIKEQLTIDNGQWTNVFIGNLGQLKDITEIYKIDEIIFCGKDMPAQKIIDLMANLQLPNIEFKIAPPESLYIIGSNAIIENGELRMENGFIGINCINNITNRRNKRFIDFLISMLLLVLTPVAIFIVHRPIGYIRNILLVLCGYKSWVGYDIGELGIRNEELGINISGFGKLPKIKEGVLYPSDAFSNRTFSEDLIFKMNMLYAKDYKATNDLNIIFKGFRELGR